MKLGGSGEGSYADFDYWVANAALKVNLDSIGQGGSDGGHNHANHDGHPNIPAGVLFGHTLEKSGDMMVGYRFMHSQQAGDFLHGDGAVSELQAATNGCPGSVHLGESGYKADSSCTLLPKEMTMNMHMHMHMHMLDIMYAPTDWLTLMLMPQFVDMQMPVYQPESVISTGHTHGGGHTVHDHVTGGIGDTGMYALVKLFDNSTHHLHTSLGFTAPTGDVGIKVKDGTYQGAGIAKFNIDGPYIHYGMQLGSGTWDFKPSLTYSGKADAWSWGGQVGGTLRLEDANSSGYALGDLFESSVWGGYDLTHWLSASVRLAYAWQGSIKNHYPYDRKFKPLQCNQADYTYSDDLNGDGIPDGSPFLHQAEYSQCLVGAENLNGARNTLDHPSPMDNPSNYGGHYVDVGFGLSATVPSGSLAGNRLAFEWLQPVYTDVNGYQLDRDGALSFTWSYGF